MSLYNYSYTHPDLQKSILKGKILESAKSSVINDNIKLFSQNNNNNESYVLYRTIDLNKDGIKSFKNLLGNQQKIEIELNLILKKSELNSSSELMKINITKNTNKESKIQIQITNPNEPLFLYSLELSELEYQQLKSEQKLLVEFQKFPEFIQKMLDLCQNDQNGKYSCILSLDEDGENNLNSAGNGILTIEEKTEYRTIELLKLKLKAANDVILKKYLSDISKNYKEKYESINQQYNDLKLQFESLQKENNILKDNNQKLENEHKVLMDNLLNEKNKEINDIKEKNIKDNKQKLEDLEKEKNAIINDLENQISQLRGNLDDINDNKTQLEKNKLQLEFDQKDLEGRFQKSYNELNIYKKEIENLRNEYSELNQKYINEEKLLTEYKYKNESILRQLEEKKKSLENMNQLVDKMNKERDSNEDTIKSLKASNNKLESKLQLSIKEIKKANDIIQKLQNEIKSQKSAMISTKNEMRSKEDVINQNQTLLDEQNKTIIDLKKENEQKDQEISEMKNKINIYTNKLDENEKLIEENKNLILYLNRNANNIFSSRINYSAINLNHDNLNINSTLKTHDSFGIDENTINNINLYNENSNNKYNSKNMFNSTIPKNFENDKFKSNVDFTYSEDVNENKDQSNTQSYISYRQSGNNFIDTTGMILPETNFTGFKTMSYTERKYINNNNNNNNNSGLDIGNNGPSLLMHKYGNYSKTFDKNNNNTQRFKTSGSNSSGFNNIEDNYPRE